MPLSAYATRIAPPMINDIDISGNTAWAVYSDTNQVVSFVYNGTPGFTGPRWNTPTVIAGGNIGSQDGTGTAARFKGLTGITKVGDDLYVTEFGNAAIRKINIATKVVTTFKTDISGATMITNDGTNLYVTGNNQVKKIGLTSPFTVTLLAGSNDGASGSNDNTTGTLATLDRPNGITQMNGKLYVACGDGKIRSISLTGTNAVSTVTTFDIGSVSYGITNDGTNLYATNINEYVWKITPNGADWNSPVAFILNGGSNFEDIAIADARVRSPRGLVYSGSLFIVDQGDNAIRYTFGDTEVQVGTFDTPNVYIIDLSFEDCVEHEGFLYFTSFGNNTNAGLILKVNLIDLRMYVVSGELWSPNFMTFVGDDLYVSSQYDNLGLEHEIYKVNINNGNSNRICKLNYNLRDITSVDMKLYIATPSAILEFNTADTSNPILDDTYVIAGDTDDSDSYDDTGTYARFDNIAGLTHDDSNLYIAENPFTRRIRKMVLSSKVVTTIAGGGDNLSRDNIAVGIEARFGSILDITIFGNYLYIGDNTSDTVRRISLTSPHAVTTVAGDVDRGDGTSLDINIGIGTAPFWNNIFNITTDSSGNLYIISRQYNDEGTPLFAKLMLTGGGGAVGDPYVTTIHGQRYKLPIADMPIRFYQGMVDGKLLTVNAQLRTTDNADLFAENMRSYLAHKNSMPKKKLKELEYALYSTEKLCFFEKFYIQYGDSEITLNVWDHKFKFESYKGKVASSVVDGNQLTNTYSDIYKNYINQTLKFAIGDSGAVYVSVYPGTMLKNGIFIEAPELSKGNGVLVNVLNASQMTLPSLKSLDPVVKKDSRLKEKEEWFLDHDGYRTRNVRCA
jgi:hypothetical protein